MREAVYDLPRRYGKNSLIMNILEKLEDRSTRTVYIDLYKATSLNRLLELYSRKIAFALENKLEKAINFVREVIPGIRPKATIDGKGNATLGIEYINTPRDVIKCLIMYTIFRRRLLRKRARILSSPLMSSRRY